MAANEGKAGAVKALLGAAWKDQILNATNDESWTPLMLAASSQRPVVCRLLLEAGAYVRCETRSRTTALHYVARWLPDKELETTTINSILDLFLTCGALINAANQHGVTPLHEAAQMGNHEVVRFLLKRGASSSVTDKFGQTAHSMAARKGFTEVCKAFTDHEEKVAQAKEKEMRRESVAMLSEEDKKKLELDQHNSIRLNPLTGDRRSVAAPSRSMALTLALYSGSDRPTAPAVLPVSVAPQPPAPKAVNLGNLSGSGERPASPPMSPKGTLIRHSPEEAYVNTQLPVTSASMLGNSGLVSPRRSVNMALLPMKEVEVQLQQSQHQIQATRHSMYLSSPPRSVPAPLPPAAPITVPVPTLPVGAVSTSPPNNLAPPLRGSGSGSTGAPNPKRGSSGATSPMSEERAALAASTAIPMGQEKDVGQWMAFLAECGIPQASRLAVWLVKEGVELDESSDLPDDFMKALTFSNVVSPPDLVVLYKRYWTLRGSSLK